MLSLGRRLGEYVMIGDQIKVTVIEKDGYLRLAIDAPRDIPIIRGEVLDQKADRPPAPSCESKKNSRK